MEKNLLWQSQCHRRVGHSSLTHRRGNLSTAKAQHPGLSLCRPCRSSETAAASLIATPIEQAETGSLNCYSSPGATRFRPPLFFTAKGPNSSIEKKASSVLSPERILTILSTLVR